MSACEEDKCGFNAECIEDECICDEGFFVSQDFVVERNNRDCAGNTALLISLYILLLLAVLLSLYAYLSRVKRKSQAKRLIPYFIGMGCYLVLGILKLSDIEGRFYGEDAAITVLLAMLFPISIVASHVMLIKNVKLMHKMAFFKPAKSKNRVKRHESLLHLNSFFSFVAAVLFISTLAAEDEKDIQILFRCSFGIMIMTSLAFSISHYRFGREITEILSGPATHDAKVRTLKLRAERVKLSSSVGQFIFMLFYIAAATSHDGLELYSYLAPLHGIITCLVTVVVVHSNSVKSKKKKALDCGNQSNLMSSSSYLGNSKAISSSNIISKI